MALAVSLAMPAQAAVTVRAKTTQAKAAPVPQCTTSSLQPWEATGAGSSAAGSTFHLIQVTNISGRTCFVHGFLGLSATNGQQIGNAATWVKSKPAESWTLRPGKTAHTVLQVVNPANFAPAVCQQTEAIGLQVYPPNQTQPTFIPLALRVCAGTKTPVPDLMETEPLQPGVAIPGINAS